MKLLQRIPSYQARPGGSFRAWLFTIARNEAANFRRHCGTRPLPSDHGLDNAPAPVQPEFHEQGYRCALVHAVMKLIRSDLPECDLLIAALKQTPPPTIPEEVLQRLTDRVVKGLLTTPENGTTPMDFVIQQPILASAQDWPPARLGQFRILEELGHGGMGYVFAAEDEKLGRRVALKVLHPVYRSMPGSGEQFLREAQAAAKVERANIVPILHVGEDRGTPFIVMPLLKGETLKSRLTRGPLSVGDTIRWGRQIAAGLLAAHAAQLVRGDLKPGNVWLDHSGCARILDFGLARHADSRETLAKPEGLQGTPPYLAPEQIDGSPATARSDLFALGAILYECLTGQRAFDGSTTTDIFEAVVSHHPPPVSTVNPSVPPELSDLVQRLLAKNPNQRPASAAEVVAVLDRIHKQLTEATQTGVGRLPPNLGNRYTAPDAKPGVATVVLLATPEPLPYSDEVIQAWFKGLPELKLPPGGEQAAVWFDNFLQVQDPSRQRTFGVVGSDDAFARWQEQLQSVLRDKVHFQSAVSFARVGDKP